MNVENAFVSITLVSASVMWYSLLKKLDTPIVMLLIWHTSYWKMLKLKTISLSYLKVAKIKGFQPLKTYKSFGLR